MKKESIIKKNYKHWISNISLTFKQSQIKAATFVNSTMLRFYYCLGHDICRRMKENKYGNNFYKKLSLDLRIELPDVHSFSETNLKYMVYFYKLYCNNDLNNYKGDLLISQQEVTKLDFSIRPQVGDESSNRFLPQLVEEINIPPFNIPWGHNKAIIDKCKGNKDKALFFVDQVIKNGWSRGVLLNFLDTDLYEEQE